MATIAAKDNPKLWERIKGAVIAGDKGGRPGQWSARKAQLAVQRYKKAGGGYIGARSPGNHLARWTREDWGTRSGGESTATGERYLPKAARARLTDEEYSRTSRQKQADTKAGRQFSRQPGDIARKTAFARK